MGLCLGIAARAGAGAGYHRPDLHNFPGPSQPSRGPRGPGTGLNRRHARGNQAESGLCCRGRRFEGYGGYSGNLGSFMG